MGWCEKDVILLLTYRSYIFPALTHQYIGLNQQMHRFSSDNTYIPVFRVFLNLIQCETASDERGDACKLQMGIW